MQIHSFSEFLFLGKSNENPSSAGPVSAFQHPRQTPFNPHIQKWVGLLYLRVSLFCLRLVFVAYGQLAWSSLLAVEIWLGLFNLQWKFGLVFFYLRC